MTNTHPGPADVPPSVRMYEMLYSSLVSQVLIAVADIGVADAFDDGPSHVDDLADRLGCHAESLYRALRALASVGVFSEVAPRTFTLTPLARTLRGDGPDSMRDLARYLGRPERQLSFGAMAHTLRTGRPAFDHVNGTDLWSLLGSRSDLGTLFDRAMGNMARMVNSSTLAAHDLSAARRLVDVGGGHGHLVATLLTRYSELTAVVFDLPRVIPEAVAVLGAAGVLDRVECVAGDFFTSVPEGGDTYLLSWTIHDWDDEDSVRILRNVRAAMGDTGRELILIDDVLPEGDAPHFGKFEDIVILTLLTGRSRTESEFAKLLSAAGFRHVETRPTSAPTSLLIAHPV
ncbi:methyltransferase [Actinokineospora cianjurensis]|uniref:Hydroxyneurosporene-O-methyltransferase n=1 Tax=Actinokineospora cianjurensis TaxID=585224 RepID=A0A421AYW5_9PSEU|nr:methyltransferase [Actinokineospora cianjurensis]RLK54995.1 hydroxyneurosporene-O-methyltransferase [Actinokineospora cianjurensis]